MSVSATTATLYPTITLTQDDGTPTDETVTSKAPDHIALHGTLANGALVSVSLRGGYKSTPGRHQLVWVIDGDAGSILVEGVGPGGAFVQIRPPKLYLDGDEVEVESDNYLPRILAAQFAEFAKGEEGTYATLDDAVKTRGLLDAIAKSGQRRVDI
ncbi:hypothetical protein J3R83DRAFT_1541 [Lanmaoa asiatica]|nr:hypothetical protein J3R83DRAFT_1541 [Lanmaoa asiatica]